MINHGLALVNLSGNATNTNAHITPSQISAARSRPPTTGSAPNPSYSSRLSSVQRISSHLISSHLIASISSIFAPRFSLFDPYHNCHSLPTANPSHAPTLAIRPPS